MLIYQEQVMQAAQVMAGYTLGGADLLRRAMGKKDKEKMAKERDEILSKAAQKLQRHQGDEGERDLRHCWRNSRATASTGRTPRPTRGSATRPRI